MGLHRSVHITALSDIDISANVLYNHNMDETIEKAVVYMHIALFMYDRK